MTGERIITPEKARQLREDGYRTVKMQELDRVAFRNDDYGGRIVQGMAHGWMPDEGDLEVVAIDGEAPDAMVTIEALWSVLKRRDDGWSPWVSDNEWCWAHRARTWEPMSDAEAAVIRHLHGETGDE